MQGSDGSFYGTTFQGGTNGLGAIFKISANGALTPLYSFTGGDDGALPVGGIIRGSDGNFYGTSLEGGTNGGGAVFKISASGAFTSLYSFTGGDDGALPYGDLVQGSDGNFYGATHFGGLGGNGVLFRLSTGLGPGLAIQTTGDFGVQTNGFGFDLTGAGGSAVVIQATTNLINPTWVALSTNTLTAGGSSHFTDPGWTNYSSRFYRLRAQRTE